MPCIQSKNAYNSQPIGVVAERLNAPVLKTGKGS